MTRYPAVGVLPAVQPRVCAIFQSGNRRPCRGTEAAVDSYLVGPITHPREVLLKYFLWRSLGPALPDGPSAIDEPISAEIFSVERLEQYAESLARTQEVSPARTAGISLHSRLESNGIALNGAFHGLISGIRRGRPVTPAAEWLVDNFYIVDEHIKAVRRDLPREFYKQLPKLANGPLRGYPRVYGLAWAHRRAHRQPF